MLATYPESKVTLSSKLQAEPVAPCPRHLYRADIDGLRAIAILSVLLYHAGVPGFPGGFTGVDIFFVISGYLIGGHIFSQIRDNTFSFVTFYQRRMKRILPALFVVLTFSILGSLFLLSPLELVMFSKSAIATVFSLSNVYFLRSSNYFNESSAQNPLLMTWSLAVEEQFYLVIPLLMLTVGKIRRGAILPVILIACVASFLLAMHQVSIAPNVAFYLLPSRAWELGIGVALAVAQKKPGRPIIRANWEHAVSFLGISALITPIVLFQTSVSFPGPNALPSVLGAALVMGCSTSWLNRKVLSMPWLTFLGRISYSWYLWHWPILAFLRVTSGGPLSFPVRLVAVLFSLVIAILSYYSIEQPFRKSSSSPLPLISRYVAVGIAFAVLLSLVWKDGGLPSRFSHLPAEQSQGTSDCMVNYGTDTPNLSAACYSVHNSPSVALWGDSHSAALAIALQSEVTARGYHFVQFSKSSCLPLVGVAKYVPSHPTVVEECVHFNQIVLKTILADNRIREVVLAGRWADPFGERNAEPLLHADAASYPHPQASEMGAIFVEALSKNIAALEAAGKQVVLIEDVPGFDFDPLCRMLTARIPARRMLASWIMSGKENAGAGNASFVEATHKSNDALNVVYKNFQHVGLIDLRPTLCDENGLCSYMDGEQLLYADAQHLTAAGSFYALRNLRLPGL